MISLVKCVYMSKLEIYKDTLLTITGKMFIVLHFFQHKVKSQVLYNTFNIKLVT